VGNTVLRCVRATIVAVAEQYYIFWVCVCSPRYLPCKCMRLNILSSVESPVVQYFSTLHNKRHDFLTKKVTEHKFCVLILTKNFVSNLFRSKNWAKIWSKMCIGLHAKYPLFFAGLSKVWIFSTDFFKKNPYILEYNPHPNLIRTSFCRFLRRKKVSSRF